MNVRKATNVSIFSDERYNSGSAFIGGFVLGGLLVGTLGCIYAPQISKVLAGTDKKDLLKKLPNFIYDEEKRWRTSNWLLSNSMLGRVGERGLSTATHNLSSSNSLSKLSNFM
ncbi:hypothetical protein L2E82_27503 [Cichorium intybus]|uniref:Uncharacterized protein n=1 Tax=Cichorium intybus TaxID=13427 RepID=A0ACB9CT75_CICIN|nr:hypothetical protein L2E82_27503 [Cichorium intybus]